MAVIPPWIEARPAEFPAAAEAGARIGIARQAQVMQMQDSQQQLVAQAQRFDLAKQQMQADAQARMASIALSKQESDRRHQLGLAQLTVQSEIKKQQIDAQSRQLAQKFQQRQQYQQTMQQILSQNPEMDPGEAAMKASFMTGFSNPGLAEMARTSKPSAAETPVFSPEGKFIGVRVGNQIKMAMADKKPVEWSDPFEMQGHQVQRNLNTGEVKVITKPDADAELNALKSGAGGGKAAPGSKGKIDKAIVAKYLQDAGGNVAKARQQAIDDGYTF